MTDDELLRALDVLLVDAPRGMDALHAKAAARLRELIAERNVTDVTIPFATHLEIVTERNKRIEAAERERDKWHRNAEDWARLYDTEAIKREKYAGERDKLREALRRISLGSKNSMTSKEDLGRDARAALAPEQGKEPKRCGHKCPCGGPLTNEHRCTVCGCQYAGACTD